mmetsp:Transcript_10981/g.18111  ORF Transcript_10981/g.18111 Transcript_10981/m.18111 type:complete len:224 (-) Transcript_10981:342-1013(-)
MCIKIHTCTMECVIFELPLICRSIFVCQPSISRLQARAPLPCVRTTIAVCVSALSTHHSIVHLTTVDITSRLESKHTFSMWPASAKAPLVAITTIVQPNLDSLPILLPFHELPSIPDGGCRQVAFSMHLVVLPLTRVSVARDRPSLVSHSVTNVSMPLSIISAVAILEFTITLSHRCDKLSFVHRVRSICCSFAKEACAMSLVRHIAARICHHGASVAPDSLP